MIEITDHSGFIRLELGHNEMDLLPNEQRELLEALARVHGFTLVDREERKSLLALTEEADEDENDYDSASAAWVVWQDRCEALASAVNGLFDTRTEV